MSTTCRTACSCTPALAAQALRAAAREAAGRAKLAARLAAAGGLGELALLQEAAQCAGGR